MNTEMYRIFFEIQKRHWWFFTKKNIILDTISRNLDNKKDLCILDIGCGSGLMLNSLEKLGMTSGMDMSDEAISFSREIFSGTIRKGALPSEVPYPNDQFDLITALDVIEHIDDDQASLERIRSLLKKDGKCILTVPAYMCLWSKFDELNEHKRRYTKKQLLEKLELSGFKVEKLSYYNTLLFPIVYIIRKLNNILHRNGSSDVDMPNPFLNSVLKMIFGIEKYLLRYCNMPFGVSIIAVLKK
jgi:SAM-dependent methyltransferase